jgi:hypothetical protein
MDATRSRTRQPPASHFPRVLSCWAAARCVTALRVLDLYKIHDCHASRNSTVFNSGGIGGSSRVAVTRFRSTSCRDSLAICSPLVRDSTAIVSGFARDCTALCSFSNRMVYRPGRPFAPALYPKTPDRTHSARTRARLDRLPRPDAAASSSSHHRPPPLVASVTSSQQPDGPISRDAPRSTKRRAICSTVIRPALPPWWPQERLRMPQEGLRPTRAVPWRSPFAVSPR